MALVGEQLGDLTVPAVVDVLPMVSESGLSEADLARVWAAVEASTSANTKAAYRSDWARFETWASGAGYTALPASGMVVAAYLTAAAGERRPDGRPRFGAATLSRWVSSINQIHTAAGFAAPGRSEVVRRALSGVRRQRVTPPKRRTPLLLADLRRILAVVQPSFWVWPTAMAAHRDAALLVMGFTGAFRRTELVGLRVEDVIVHPVDGLHVRIRSSKTDQEGIGVVRALPYGRDPATCPPCALIRWRQLLEAFDGGGRAAAMAQIDRRGLSGVHVCRGTPGASAVDNPGLGGDNKSSVWTDGAEQMDNPGGSADGVEEKQWLSDRSLFPTVHKTGRPGVGAMSGDAVAVMIQRRAAAGGYTPAQVDLLGGHSLRAGFVTEAFRAGADAHSIMRQTGHRDPKMLEVYAREYAPWSAMQ